MENSIIKYDKTKHKIAIRGSYLKLMKLTRSDVPLSYDNIIYAFNDTYHTSIGTRSIGLGIIKRYENLVDAMKKLKREPKLNEVSYNKLQEEYTQFKNYTTKMGDMFSNVKFRAILSDNNWSFGVSYDSVESKIEALQIVSIKIKETIDKFDILWESMI